jgi:7-keto-8-aminopelargonate synthetase-like enzyme
LLAKTRLAKSAATPLPAPKLASVEIGSAIHPIIIGDEQAAIDLSGALEAQGFLAPAIRYPTVTKGAARLRITVTASHTEAQITTLGKAIRGLIPEPPVAP